VTGPVTVVPLSSLTATVTGEPAPALSVTPFHTAGGIVTVTGVPPAPYCT
jgi:hypothetical protein